MRLRRFKRDERGAAAVEFALVLPILIVLLFGIVDFGRALFAYNYLTAAVREGGRYAAVYKDVKSGTFQSDVQGRMQVYLGQLNSLGLDDVPANKITATPNNLVSPTHVTVSITGYEVRPITPIPKLVGISGNFKFSPSAVFRWEREGT